MSNRGRRLFYLLCFLMGVLLAMITGCDSDIDPGNPPTPPLGVGIGSDAPVGTPLDQLPDCEWPSPAPGALAVTICGDPTLSHIALCYMIDMQYQPIVGRTNCQLGGYACVWPCP